MANDRSSDLDVAERRGEAEFASAAPFSPVAPSGLLGRLIRTRPAKPPYVIDAAAPVGPSATRWKRPSAYLISFIACVVAPAVAASLYFACIASDQFEAETRFAVRSATNDPNADKAKPASLSTSPLPVIAGQDAFIVSAYIRSRAIVDDLSKVIDLREVFRRPEADFWARLKRNASAEQLTEYWDGMVSAYVDGPSGIVTVRVKAFRPDDALSISNAIIKASEALANQISVRARADAMKLAEHEVQSAEGRVLSTLADLRSFRDQAGFIDPTQQATSTGALLTDLLAQKIKMQNNYFVASRAMSPEAPTVQSMKARLEALDQQIDEQRAKLTGDAAGASTIASLLPKFEELELQNRFSERLYTLATDGLARARQRAEAQNLYVSVFVPPALPEEALFPERFGLSVVIALGLTVLWGIAALTAAVIEDHRI
jgi:capsular polysaccharide transport system permease protein